jgi:hypothetical protein
LGPGSRFVSGRQHCKLCQARFDPIALAFAGSFADEVQLLIDRAGNREAPARLGVAEHHVGADSVSSSPGGVEEEVDLGSLVAVGSGYENRRGATEVVWPKEGGPQTEVLKSRRSPG